jgi:hypothetical protein
VFLQYDPLETENLSHLPWMEHRFFWSASP